MLFFALALIVLVILGLTIQIIRKVRQGKRLRRANNSIRIRGLFCVYYKDICIIWKLFKNREIIFSVLLRLVETII